MNIKDIDLNSLVLDPENDRFAELYSGSNKEEDLIEYLLYTEAAEEIAKNIADKGLYYPDETLWVVKRKNKFLVKDGNRRCAAVKALQIPKKYGLNLKKLEIHDLPALIYEDEKVLDSRIQEQHTGSLFRQWERIAKALKAHEMHDSGSSESAIKELDSNPGALVKLASFYYGAVKIGGEGLKQLLRRGRGKTGGKTTIFERLFPYSKKCGYRLKNKPSYQIEILGKKEFEDYINAMISYLNDKPETTYKEIDTKGAGFLDKLKEYGFTPVTKYAKKNNTGSKNKSGATSGAAIAKKKGSVKTKPSFVRKQVAPKLKVLINECYNLDDYKFANAKVALARVTFESVLKFIVLETEYNGTKMCDYKHFKKSFYSKRGTKLPFTNFTQLKKDFTDLILNQNDKKAFIQFSLDRLHQVIHNYKTGASPGDARTASENLIPLIEFMLNDESDLLRSINTKRLV